MRNCAESILKRNFRIAIIQFRQENCLTQEQMAQRLGISLRCYCNLESGRSCCSAVTLMMFLQMCNDSEDFIREMRLALEEEQSGVV